jgi:hypothetical protein
MTDAERYVLLAQAASVLDDVNEDLAEEIRGYLDWFCKSIPKADSNEAGERLRAAGFH